jgi:hypothetical protein
MANSDIASEVLAQSAPVASETALVSPTVPTKITSIRLAGDATGGAITVHIRKAAAAAAAANALTLALVIGNATNVPATGVLEVCPQGGFLLNAGDILSALGASGGHVTVTVCGAIHADA